MQITGLPFTVLEMSPRSLLLPMAKFVDLVEEGDEQFAITTGNTNLFEIQQDWNTPSTKDFLVSR